MPKTLALLTKTVLDDQPDDLIDITETRLLEVGNQLVSGKINLSEWQVQTASILKRAHVANLINARGSRVDVTQIDLGRVGAIIAGQYKYLNRFAISVEDDLDNSKVLGNAFLNRLSLYAYALRGSFSEIEKSIRAEQGYTEEAWVTSASESCSGCIEQERLGWQPIDVLPAIGSQLCQVNCRCEKIYR